MLNEKKDSSIDLTIIRISSDGTHHVLNRKPLYKTRFLKVLSFHEPGIAAVLDKSGAYHINLKGVPIYNKRFKTTFGYYQRIAAVCDEEGYYHINQYGNPVYNQHYAWSGNYQETMVPICDLENNYFHLTKNGTLSLRDEFQICGRFQEWRCGCLRKKCFAHQINNHGVFINNRKYRSLWPFHKGFAIAEDCNGFFHINTNGEDAYSGDTNGLSLFTMACLLWKTSAQTRNN